MSNPQSWAAAPSDTAPQLGPGDATTAPSPLQADMSPTTRDLVAHDDPAAAQDPEEAVLKAYTDAAAAPGGPPGQRELTRDVLSASLSALGHNPDGGVVFTTATLASLGLRSITAVKDFRYLQKVLLSHNSVSSLGPLTACRSLAYLSAAHNALKDGEIAVLAPLSETLQYLDVSGNGLTALDGVASLRYLTTLLADDNNVEVLPQEGPGSVRGLKSLWRLALGNNGLEAVEPEALLGCPLRTLDLSRNKVKTLQPLRAVAGTLTALSLEDNDLMHLDGVAAFERLSLLELAGNNIYALEEVRLLEALPKLRTVTLIGNPFCTLGAVADPALSDDPASDAVRSDDDGAPPPPPPPLEAAEARQVPSARVAAPLRLERNARYAAPSPSQENRAQLDALPEDEQYRLQVLWRVPAVTMLDGRRVTPDDACEAVALVGDGDAAQRREARRRVEHAALGDDEAPVAGTALSTLRKLREAAPRQ